MVLLGSSRRFTEGSEIFVSASVHLSEKPVQVLLELLWHTVSGGCEADALIAWLSEHASTIVEDTIADSVWLVATEVLVLESEEEKLLSSEWKVLCYVVQKIVEMKVVAAKLLMERLPIELLAGAELGSLNVMEGKLKRGNTNHLYRQRKYNILAEESEGFSKLINLLDTVEADNVKDVKQEMLRLIGFFRLDPNRVFDLVLEAYQHDHQNDAYLDLVDMFKEVNLKQMMGFKFQMYHPTEKENESSEEGVEVKYTPMSLYQLAAKLFQTGRLAVDDIIPHLHPSKMTLELVAKERAHRSLAACRGVGKIRLNSSSVEESEKDAASKSESAYASQVKSEDAHNQQYCLVAGMISMGQWEAAKKLAEDLGRLSSCLDHPLVLKVLFEQIELSIHPLAVKLFPSLVQDKDSSLGSFPVCEDAEGFMEMIAPVLVTLAHRLASNTTIFFHIVRILNSISNIEDNSVVLSLLDASIMPSLSVLTSPNPSLVFMIWDVVKGLPFTTRFGLYESWRGERYTESLVLRFTHATVKHESKQVLKRVANGKDAMRLVSRRFAKVSHNNPIVALSALLDNIQSYDNLIPIVVDSIKYLSPLSFDVLAYLLIVYLGKDENSKIKADGQSHSHWLQSLCKFAGFFYLKYPHVELRGLFSFMIRQLTLNRSLDLLILEDVIARMSGVDIVEDISDDTLLAMAGGGTLRKLARASTITTIENKYGASERLAETLKSNKLIMPLLVLMAQQQQTILYDTSSNKNLKLIGHKYDKCASVLVQFTEFLSFAVPVQELACNHYLLSLVDMVSVYHMEPEVAFHITRPVIAAANHSANILDAETAAQWHIDADYLVDVSKYVIQERGYWKVLSPDLYAVFWVLSLYDVVVPRKKYDEEMSRLQKTTVDPSLSDSKKRKEVDAIADAVKQLKVELETQNSNRTRVLTLMEQKKSSWFPQGPMDGMREFISLCVLPRALFSAEDALFASRFCKMLHDLSVPGFCTIFFYDCCIKFVVANLFCVTEREAGNLGIFLKDTLATFNIWSKDQKIFNKSMSSKPGAVADFKTSAKISFVEFQTTVKEWQVHIGTVFGHAFESKSYMQIRPALVITSKLLDFFPMAQSVAFVLKEKAARLGDIDLRQDIKTMAKRYEAMLDKAMKSGNLEEDIPKPATTKKRSRSEIETSPIPHSKRSKPDKDETSAPEEKESSITKKESSQESNVSKTATNSSKGSQQGNSRHDSRHDGKSSSDANDKTSHSTDNRGKDMKGHTNDNRNRANANRSRGNDSKSQINDTKSRSNDSKSQATDTKSRSNDSKSQVNDTKSQSNDNKSQSNDNKSQPNDNKSRSNDTKSQPNDNKSRSNDNKSQSNDSKSRINDNKSRSNDDKSQANDNKSRNNDAKSHSNDNQSRSNDTKSHSNDNKSRNSDTKSHSNDNKSRSNDNQSRSNDNKGQANDSKSRNNDNKSRANDNNSRSNDTKSQSNDTKSRSNDNKRNQDDRNDNRRDFRGSNKRGKR